MTPAHEVPDSSGGGEMRHPASSVIHLIALFRDAASLTRLAYVEQLGKAALLTCVWTLATRLCPLRSTTQKLEHWKVL
jgi:hypothetical protein